MAFPGLGEVTGAVLFLWQCTWLPSESPSWLPHPSLAASTLFLQHCFVVTCPGVAAPLETTSANPSVY